MAHITHVRPVAGVALHGLTLEQRRAFGVLGYLLDQPDVRDVLVQCDGDRASVWVDRGSRVARVHTAELGAHEARRIAVDLIGAGGRNLDELHPCADVRLGSGVRVHAVLEPIVTSGAAISIRIPREERFTLDELQRSGTFAPAMTQFLRGAIHSRKNLLVSGATGSGKTTLVGAFIDELSETERVLTIEDVAELRPRHPHLVALQSRHANSEGGGEVTLDELLRQSLRMRPDRIVLGECRGAEIATLLAALNTGHDGSFGTIHANSIEDVPARLEALGALAGMHPAALARQAVAALDLIVHVEREHGVHRIAGVATLGVDGHGLLTIGEARLAA